jgi:hypothetical protein
MSGDWNVWSLYNKQDIVYSTPMTTASTISIYKPNFIRPDATVIVQQYRTGYSYWSGIVVSCYVGDGYCTTPQVNIGDASCGDSCANCSGGICYYYFGNGVCYVHFDDPIGQSVPIPFGNLNLTISQQATYATGAYYVRIVVPDGGAVIL